MFCADALIAALASVLDLCLFRVRIETLFSVDGLAAAMADLSGKTDAEIRDMGRAARSYVERKHSKQAYFEKCSDLYAALKSMEKQYAR